MATAAELGINNRKHTGRHLFAVHVRGENGRVDYRASVPAVPGPQIDARVYRVEKDNNPRVFRSETNPPPLSIVASTNNHDTVSTSVRLDPDFDNFVGPNDLRLQRALRSEGLKMVIKKKAGDEEIKFVHKKLVLKRFLPFRSKRSVSGF